MKLTFLGTTSEKGQSPTLYVTDRGSFVVQGWKVDDAEALAEMKVPAHETAVKIPRELLRLVPSSD